MGQFRPLLVIGTRPEAIKMAPLVRACRQQAGFRPLVCISGQHREMVTPLIDYFDLQPDRLLDVMVEGQSLADLTARCLSRLHAYLQEVRPDCVVAQGDTTTVMAAATAAFFARRPFVHVEAGLRTGDLEAPWPEEYHRRVAGISASLHCAPTERAAENLRREGVPERSVRVTGNTVVDALLWTARRERRRDGHWRRKYARLGDRRLVLITGHRRENFGHPFERICRSVAGLAARYPDTIFLYPVHLNPRVREPVHRILSDQVNVELIAPVDYPEFVWLMDRASLIISDSGGVQEEAPSLHKPVLVTRDVTERPEAVESGAVELVGTSGEKIMSAACARLDNDSNAPAETECPNPYGDGTAARRIVSWMNEVLVPPAVRAA